ncbi:hypothetical protein ASD79_02485 [Caulobacter sp. Root655]|uniref:RHS repeat protein n=1 Tax=Caulobacter sp. Root655 TaxID=1736578 RepID=UPI0006F2A563|nr:RHS repeat protein [Caulobacter sp. Root655]KRA66168.1 hypothetical protein ASD79_02485 [Caulobacter sp. Root655]
MRRAKLLPIVAASVAAMVGGPAAYAALPAVKLLTAPLVTPADAWNYYGGAEAHSDGVLAWTTPPPEIKAMARSLGASRLTAGLGQIDTDQYASNIAAYVRNNIKTEFRFGLAKGGRGALIDLSGTPFDQADLMVRLLRAGGVSSSFQTGTITLNAQQFGQWTGLIKGLDPVAQTFTVDGKAACQLLADGGVPATVNGANDCALVSGDLSTVTLTHVWVQTNGKLYDPSFKRHRLATPVALSAVTGCAATTCAATVTTQAMAGATTGVLGTMAIPYVQNVNAGGVTAGMNAIATQTEASLRATTYANMSFSDFTGQKKIDASFSPVASASLPYIASTQFTWNCDAAASTCGVPDQYRATFTMTIFGQSYTFFGDEAANRVLVIRNYGLYSDGVKIATYSCTTCGVTLKTRAGGVTGVQDSTTMMGFSVNHPYAANGGVYADDSGNLVVYDVARNAVTIVDGFGDSGLAAQQAYADLEVEHNAVLGTSASLVRPESGAAIGILRSQQSLVEGAVGAAFSTPVTRHHVVGLINFGTISAQHSLSLQSATSDAATLTASFKTVALLDSIFETAIENAAVHTSAPSLFVLANEKGIRFMNFTSAQASAALLQTQNYTTDDKARIIAGAGEGFDFILPQNSTTGCFTLAANPDNGSVSGQTCLYAETEPSLAYRDGKVSYLIGNELKGQGVKIPEITPRIERADYSLKQKSYYSVDLARGALTIKPAPDITTGAGEFPMSLSFMRTYDSGASVREMTSRAGSLQNSQITRSYSAPGTRLQVVGSSAGGEDFDASGPLVGGGWSNNFLISAEIRPNVPFAFGQKSLLHASTVLSAIEVMQGVHLSESFGGRLTAMFIGDWLVNQVQENTIALTTGPDVQTFFKLPSGAYQAPSGATAKLTLSGDRIVRMVDSKVQAFTYHNLEIKYTGSDGATMTLVRPGKTLGGVNRTTGNLVHPSKWEFSNGVVVNFTYNNRGLTSVYNNLGRSLTFVTGGDTSSSIQSIVDDSGRTVSYALSDCPWTHPELPSSYPETLAMPAIFACNTLKVTRPDQTVETYSYAAGDDSPNPSVVVKSSYRLRRWYLPSNSTTPYRLFTYDDVFHLSSIKDPLGRETKYFEGSIGDETLKVTEVVSPGGDVERHVFDDYNSLLSSEDALHRKITKRYDASQRLIGVTYPESNSATYTYDVRSNLKTESNISKSGSEILTATTNYMEGSTVWSCVNIYTCDKPLTETDARNNTTTYTWDSTTGQMTKVVKPLGAQTDLSYDSYAGTDGGTLRLPGRKTEKVSASQNIVTTYAYDAAKKFVLKSAAVDPGGAASSITCFKFDAVGNPIGVTDPRAGACP